MAMKNNSDLISESSETVCSYFVNLRARLGPTYDLVSLIVAAVNMASAPLAVAGNALVLAAIWRNPSLKTPSFVLLAGLAFTDFCTGLIIQPISAVYKFTFVLKKQQIYCATGIASERIGTYFPLVTIMTLTLMSIERWLHMTRRTFLTLHRIYVIYAVFLAVPVPIIVLRYSSSIAEGFKTSLSGLISSLAGICCVITSVAYFGVFRIIRRHQMEIQASQLSQNINRPCIDLKKYKKSVFTILYIWALFLASYIPVICSYIATFVYKDESEVKLAVTGICSTIMNLSSLFNPLLYCSRIANLRNEMRQLLKKMF